MGPLFNQTITLDVRKRFYFIRLRKWINSMSVWFIPTQTTTSAIATNHSKHYHRIITTQTHLPQPKPRSLSPPSPQKPSKNPSFLSHPPHSPKIRPLILPQNIYNFYDSYTVQADFGPNTPARGLPLPPINSSVQSQLTAAADWMEWNRYGNSTQAGGL